MMDRGSVSLMRRQTNFTQGQIGQLDLVLPGTNAVMQLSYMQLLDFLTTVAFLINGVSEANPIVVFAMRNMGHHPLIGLALVKVVAVGSGLYCWTRGRLTLLHRTNACFA